MLYLTVPDCVNIGSDFKLFTYILTPQKQECSIENVNIGTLGIILGSHNFNKFEHLY